MKSSEIGVRIESVQAGADGRAESIRTFAVGRKGARGGKTYICYAEPAEGGLENTTTLLAFDDKKLVLTRLGAIEQKLEFETGKTSSCLYKAPFMAAQMTVETRMLNIRASSGAFCIYVEYLLSMASQPVGLVKLRILAGEGIALEH